MRSFCPECKVFYDYPDDDAPDECPKHHELLYERKCKCGLAIWVPYDTDLYCTNCAKQITDDRTTRMIFGGFEPKWWFGISAKAISQE